MTCSSSTFSVRHIAGGCCRRLHHHKRHTAERERKGKEGRAEARSEKEEVKAAGKTSTKPTSIVKARSKPLCFRIGEKIKGNKRKRHR
jgi:hypothetical protein